MKRSLAALLLVLFLSTAASAASSVWKAQQGKSVIYLGGTCHVLRDSDYPLPAEFDKAYRASDTVVFETDIGKLQDLETQQKLMSRAMYLDGSTLRDHLSPKTYSSLQQYCEANNVPLALFGQFKPSMLMMTLTLMELTKLGVTQQGVDQFYYQQALKDKKAVAGLETVEEQMDYLAAMSDGNEDQFVSYSLQDMSKLDKQFNALADAWRKGESAKLYELMVEELKSRQPALYKKLITDRNRAWLREISRYSKSPGTRFVLVGVGHLVGPDGLIESLKRQGYKVEKL